MNAAAPQVRENFARLSVDRPSHVAFGFRAQLVLHFLVVVHIHYLREYCFQINLYICKLIGIDYSFQLIII